MLIAVVCLICVEISDVIYNSTKMKRFRDAINQSQENPYWSSKVMVGICVVTIFVISIAVFAAIYFFQRFSYIMQKHGIDVSPMLYNDIMNLQIQFLFLDVDWFKKINDSLGHMAGDETLRKVAQNFQETFDKTGAVGRVGGDEFAVMIEEPMNRAQMEEKLLQFQRAISTILPEEKVSCSIGVYHFTFPQEIKHLLRETDMYMAKERGRACYVIQESPAGESEWCD